MQVSDAIAQIELAEEMKKLFLAVYLLTLWKLNLLLLQS